MTKQTSYNIFKIRWFYLGLKNLILENIAAVMYTYKYMVKIYNYGIKTLDGWIHITTFMGIETDS